MRKIHVLGTGCPKCGQLEANVRMAGAAHGEQVIVIKVSDIREIMAFGVMITPAIVELWRENAPAKVEITQYGATEATYLEIFGPDRQSRR